MIVTIRDDRVEERPNCSGICGSCSDDARVIYPITTYGAADAASDLIVDVVIFFLGLRVVVGDVCEAVSRAIMT